MHTLLGNLEWREIRRLTRKSALCPWFEVRMVYEIVGVENSTLRCGRLAGVMDEARDKCLGTSIDALNIGPRGLPSTTIILIFVNRAQFYVRSLIHLRMQALLCLFSYYMVAVQTYSAPSR